MSLTIIPINPGSYHIRLYKDDAVLDNKPPYISHSILEAIGDGGAELKGLSTKVSKKDYKETLKAAKFLGFTYVKVTRIKGNIEVVKIYD